MIDPRRLQDLCQRAFESFGEFGRLVPTPVGRGYFFDDRGQNVLGVAHLDTYLRDTRFEHRGGQVFCPALDDRLGAHLLLDLLPAFGVQFDLLLTDGEEQGRSTARFFQPPRLYHWVFEFDRAGTDVVLYQYDSPECRQMLDAGGFVVGHGTSSDIRCLDHLGCKGFNFGCGYHQQHTSACFASLEETDEMVRKFVRFWWTWKDIRMPHP